MSAEESRPAHGGRLFAPGQSKICVMGLGYIGLPTASILANKGYHVLGVDVRPTWSRPSIAARFTSKSRTSTFSSVRPLTAVS